MPPQDPQGAWQKASSIGPAQVGERYLETEAPPSILDLVRQLFLGPARPTTVAAQDPYGIEAWQKGTGPMPVMLGTTNGVGDPGLVDTLKKQFPRFGKALEEFGALGTYHPEAPGASPSWSTAVGKLRDIEPPPSPEALKRAADRERVLARRSEAPIERSTMIGGRPMAIGGEQQGSLQDFVTFASTGKIHGATGVSTAAEEAATTSLTIGEAAGYSPQDIAHFYIQRRGNPALGAYELLKDAWKEGRPVNAELWDQLVTKPPENSIRDGALYVRPGAKPTESLLVSPRVPWSVTAPRSQPGDPLLLANLAAVKEDPELLAKFAAQFRTYPMITAHEATLNDEGVIDAFMASGQQNLQWLWNQTPPETRERSKLWYVGGNAIGHDMAAQTGVQPVQAHAAIATLSPQKEWFNNVEVARRINTLHAELWKTNIAVTQDIWDVYGAKRLQGKAADLRKLALKEGQDVADDMRRAIEARIAKDGRRYIGVKYQDLPLDGQGRVLRTISELTQSPHYPILSPEGHTMGLAMTAGPDPRPMGIQWNSNDQIVNALSVLQDGSPANISRRLGQEHKVRSFFNNLSNPFDPRSLTVDTHQVGATHLQPFSQKADEVNYVMGGAASADIGIGGANPIYGDIGKNFAAANDVVPAQGQSVVWETERRLFRPEDKKKGSPLPKTVAQLWRDYHTGKITRDQLYDDILNASRGITRPAWESPK